VKYLCAWLGVSRSGYYAWRNRGEPERAKANAALLRVIERIHKDSRETYGSPRVHAQLCREGHRVGSTRVERLMRVAGLKGRAALIYRRVPGLHRFFGALANRRLDRAAPDGVDQQWAADLTYIRLGRQWRFLAVVLDLYSRRIVGWSMGRRRTVQLTAAALTMALRKRRPAKGLVLHTDRGIEYRAYAIQDIHCRHGIVASMNRPGRCTDNAEVESFFHTLKGELLRGRDPQNNDELRGKVAGYIQHFYNRTRLHSGLGYRSPAEFEAMSA